MRRLILFFSFLIAIGLLLMPSFSLAQKVKMRVTVDNVQEDIIGNTLKDVWVLSNISG